MFGFSAYSLLKRRKLGLVRVADALSLDLGFLGRSSCVRGSSALPPRIFSLSHLPQMGFQTYSGLFLLCCLSVLPPLCVFGFWFFGSLLLLFFSISGG